MDQPPANLDAIKARQKATWEAGNFGEVAKHIESAAEEFMGGIPLRPGLRVLDAACGTGNLAVHAARAATCHRRRPAFRPRCSEATNPPCATG